MIVKCQRSLGTSNQYAQLLVYNRDRSFMMQCDLTAEWNAQFGPTPSPDDSRFFAQVLWVDKTETPVFVQRLPEQGW